MQCSLWSMCSVCNMLFTFRSWIKWNTEWNGSDIRTGRRGRKRKPLNGKEVKYCFTCSLIEKITWISILYCRVFLRGGNLTLVWYHTAKFLIAKFTPKYFCNHTLVNTAIDIGSGFFFFFTVAYAQIDWHDFVVVETVDFQPNESGKLI